VEPSRRDYDGKLSFLFLCQAFGSSDDSSKMSKVVCWIIPVIEFYDPARKSIFPVVEVHPNSTVARARREIKFTAKLSR
jgi:hypothetical protein